MSTSEPEPLGPFFELGGLVSDSFVAGVVVPLGCSDFGDGGEANSLKELSVILGIFHGNLRKDMQQKMIARDQISAGCGSYLFSSYTSGAR